MFSARLMVVVPVLAAAVVAQSEKADLSPSAKQSYPMGPSLGYSPNIYQFGYPGQQFYPGDQPPILYYGGGALPGQQFLYRPGSPPPGNFLIPQPSPGAGYPQTPGAGYPQVPGAGYPQTPGAGYPQVPGAGYPQTPGAGYPNIFQAGFPKPAHIPPIEKDAEEVPDLAGNHPPTRTGKPFYQSGQPQRIETFDEPVSAGEEDDLAEGEKVPNFFPKKPFPARPNLRPGQQFFILNGNTLFSNVPEPQVYHHQQPINHQLHFLPQHEASQSENYISLNNVADLRQAIPVVPYPSQSQPQAPVAALVIPLASQSSRAGKNFPVQSPHGAFHGPVHYPFIIALDDQQKEDDDTVTIEARPAEELKKMAEKPNVKEEEEASLSQAKPSALAISGKGGVASAGPRGTALVGLRGVAVASPEATAVAGPDKDENEKPDKKTRPKNEKRQSVSSS